MKKFFIGLVAGLLLAGLTVFIGFFVLIKLGGDSRPSLSDGTTLGVAASGLGFFLWNRGATRVSAGTLAAMNNVKIPLAVACSLVVFGEQADLPRLFLGGGLMASAVWLAQKNRASAV